MRYVYALLLFLTLALPALAQGEVTVTVSLNAGWNAVAFQTAELTSVTASPGITGFACWDGSAYLCGNLSLEELQSAQVGRRACWVLASQATSFTYTGPTGPTSVELVSGYNLVSFCSSCELPGTWLTASQEGQNVPVDAVVSPVFFEIGPDNQSTPVDVVRGGTLKPGRAYWVFAQAPGRLDATPAEPSPTPTPPLALASLTLSPEDPVVSTYGTLQFAVTATLVDGRSVDVTPIAEWSSLDPSVAAPLGPGLFKGLNPFATRVRARLDGFSVETGLVIRTVATAGPLPSPSPRQGATFPLAVVQSDGQIRRLDAAGALLTPDPLATVGTMDQGESAVDSAGNLYVPLSNGTVQKVRPDGVVTSFSSPGGTLEGILCDASGNLLVTSFTQNKVYKITPAGVASDFITGVSGPIGVAFDASGNLYVGLNGSNVRAFKPDGTVLTTWGTAGTVVTGATNTRGLAFDRAGNLYVAHLNGRIDRLNPAGTSQTVFATLPSCRQIAFNSTGELFAVVSSTNKVVRISAGGSVSDFATGLTNGRGLVFVGP